MTTTHPPEAEAAGRLRTRAWLVAGAVVVLGATFSWIGYSREVVAQHEARVLAGDFAHLRVQSGKLDVDEYGRVAVGGYLANPPLTVASTKLIPVGAYTDAIVADDGVEAHRKKTELVIAVKDAQGAWHPASAPQVLARMKAPHKPGSPL